jgi:hypothetical protein
MRPATCKKHSICLHNGYFGKLFVDWQQGDARRHSLDNQDSLRAYDCTCMYTNGDAPVPRLGRLASDFPPSESVSRRCTLSPASGNHDVHIRSSPRRRDDAPSASLRMYVSRLRRDRRLREYAPHGIRARWPIHKRIGRPAREMCSPYDVVLFMRNVMLAVGAARGYGAASARGGMSTGSRGRTLLV